MTALRPDITGGHTNGMQSGSMRPGMGPMAFAMPPGMHPGMPPAPFMAQFGQYPVTMPPNWPGATGPYAPDGAMQSGPIRRGGGRMKNGRAAGPYDRAAKDGRNMRWANGGRMSPPGRRTSAGGAPRFADAGGAATVGPREAVAGRSLKSYEDLDAVATGAQGELNY